MPEPCGRTFDEALLSGYVDDALVQGDAQRVRLHLAGCADCRSLVAEMVEVREATKSSAFAAPRDEEWEEAARTSASSLARRFGWLLLVAWAILVAAVGLREAWQETEDLVERLMLVGGVSGIALLFVGVLLDRLSARRTDRYRGVQK